MTPLEEINAAIDRLTTLRDAAGYHRHGDWLAEAITVGTEYSPVEEEAPVTNDPLMVALYDCIDPLLAILNWARRHAERDNRELGLEQELDLARAINGGTNA